MNEPGPLPCPFCGGTELHDFEEYTEQCDYQMTECETCHASAQTHKWNTRVGADLHLVGKIDSNSLESLTDKTK